MDAILIGVKFGAAAYILYEIYSGESSAKFRYSDESAHTILQRIHRDETPRFFWFSVALKIVALIFLWLWF